jgi:hypothetical protein
MYSYLDSIHVKGALMIKNILFIALLPAMAMAETCSGNISMIDHRSTGILIYFSNTGFAQITGSIDTNNDPTGATNQRYVRISYPANSVRENQLLSVAMTALSTGRKIYVEYANGGSPAWNVTSLAM